jgi:hypothetical protein
MKNTVNSIIAQPIVGVQDFALCNFSKIVAFQIVASDLIFFQSLKSISKLIKLGIKTNHTRNVAIQNVNMSTKCDSINFYF